MKTRNMRADAPIVFQSAPEWLIVNLHPLAHKMMQNLFESRFQEIKHGSN